MSQPPQGLTHSYCAAKLNEMPHYEVNRTITYRGLDHKLRHQFMVTNLTLATSYVAYMLMPTSDSSISMTTPIHLSTKLDANCRIIYNLPFCDQVAYSVPIPPETLTIDNIWSIAEQYDNQAKAKFKPFDIALSQYNCETTQYSLVRNCTDCYRDYKTWLCAVTIPRCTDSSTSEDISQGTQDVPVAPALRYVLPNASRNPWIDETLKPGEWTELLPCIDLCYHVVQSCPPFLQFYCPTGDLAALQYGYWQNGNVSVNGTSYYFDINNPTCNRMGVNTSLLKLSVASHMNTLNLFATFVPCCLALMFLFI
ncbi:stretch-activated Ca2+-permeable channel component-domain-containing protein [Mycotypha africana]|uniref:stretch-activated Ca2+-permeable channel component-domain-containing protein n=1 Tax=Mycotypha africana TaxID=64632 RepID=UPI002301537C|nr:stretch-activated Ca2+-permeable channel component-domain-containing protein [Mycotypha africana]KAI8970342.1 stretch-activated Ca2+-permeable channel component-domain-containing protein [Mycotypha africana]